MSFARSSRSQPPGRRALLRSLLLVGILAVPATPTGQPAPPPKPLYEERQPGSPDGTGRFYRGREIARVMGRQGAGWLERAERETEEQPAQLIAVLDLKPGATVADLGAGSGYFTRRLAHAVALKPGGRVAFVEHRAEDPKVPIKPLHKMSETQVKKEAAGQGFEWIETIRTLPRQHVILFRKPVHP